MTGSAGSPAPIVPAASLSLTAELVARVERREPDPGPHHGNYDLSEATRERWVARLLDTRQSDGPVWIFAYGSLIWKPAFEAHGESEAVAFGWRRSFCLWLTRWRGTPDRPGLMLALDRGGSCRGIAYRIDPARTEDGLRALLDREISDDPCSNVPRWVRIATPEGPKAALAFTADRNADDYGGGLDLDTVASVVATAAGHGGSCADYLHRTVVHLAERGIRDEMLWRLQGKVAEMIAALPPDWNAGAGNPAPARN